MIKIATGTIDRNRFLLLPLCGIAGILLFGSCGPEIDSQDQMEHTLVLDSAYQRIETIGSMAHCTGPSGPYITETYSTVNDETHFRQRYSNRSYIFEVVLESPTEGYMLDHKTGQQQPLPEMVIKVVRGHEFHKILCFPHSYFSSIKYRETSNTNGSDQLIYSCKDISGMPATFNYDPSTRRITRLEFSNPVDTTESIEVITGSWVDTDYGAMVATLDVIQATTDTFSFRYDSLNINDEWVSMKR